MARGNTIFRGRNHPRSGSLATSRAGTVRIGDTLNRIPTTCQRRQDRLRSCLIPSNWACPQQLRKLRVCRSTSSPECSTKKHLQEPLGGRLRVENLEKRYAGRPQARMSNCV